jgi:hypothetical protein
VAAIAQAITERALRMTEAARDVLLGISTYTRPVSADLHTTLDEIDARRGQVGFGNGLLPPPSYTRTRWYMSDLETAERLADMGDLKQAGQLMLAARKDGHLSGILSTRTGGLVRLPRVFRGDADVVNMLERGHDSTRAAFDELCPPSELALMAADGVFLGVAVGELIPVRGRKYPVLVRYDPQFLRYRWDEDRWYYASQAHGLIPITPGDGRWVLHTPGGRVAPWQSGLWRAVGQAWIRKQHAGLYKDAWEAKLAHPARVAFAPQGAAEEQKQAYFQQVMAWGINTVFGLVPGFDVKILESNGRGYESFIKTIEQCNEEFKLAIAGQTVTSDGGTGFANADVHKSIRADLIKETADGISHTVNTQILPVFVMRMWGADAVLTKRVTQEYDVTPPKDRNNEAQAMVSAAAAVKQLGEALAPVDLAPDVRQIMDRYGIPTLDVTDDDDLDTAGGDSAADSALNGAQIASLLQIVTACAQQQIPRDSAVAMIQRAFLVDADDASMLLGSVGAGFVPVVIGGGAAPAAPAPDPVPEMQEAA